MTEDLFFNKLVTKAMEAVHGDERFFEGYLTVQIKDKQGEITVVDELYKVLPIWMDRGAPISDTHSNRIIGKGINYAKATYKDKDGEEYPAIKITGKIHKDYELDNEIWKKIKSGEYKGLSFGGATKSDRDPVRMKDGSIAYSLKDLEHYEVAVCADPAVPLALITDYNPVAKSATNAEVREDGKMVIKCDKFGCYVTKPIPDGKGGKGDFDHCEEKNQDKNDPSAFCGAIQHKLEKAIEAGMLQQIAKNGLEIFLTKEELNKVCSACGKTLEEHGIVKYDHSNSMGDQHSMYNQNSGSETWIGQGLPQPTIEGKDDNPAEKGLTINGDAMQNSSKKKGRTARNRKRRQAKQVKEGMAMFDTPNEVDNILTDAQAEVDAQAKDTKRYNTGNPKAADMYKAFEFEDKKKDQADNIKEDSDNCPWCQKDPEGSGKPKWWRERANNWQKMLGSDNKRLGEWLSDHTFGTENHMQDTHDSDTKMHHTQSKQIPKEIEGAKEGMSGQAGAVADNMKEMGFPPSKEQSAEYEKRRKKSLESMFKDAVKPSQAQSRGESNKPKDYEHEQGADIPFLSSNINEYQNVKLPDNEFQAQSTAARDAKDTNTSFSDLDKLVDAQAIGVLTYPQDEGTDSKHRHEVKHPQLDKSLESMFKTDQADIEEEEAVVGQIVHDNESIEEKEEFDVPLPRVARAGAKPCKDCGEKHPRASLLAEDRVDDALSEKDNPFRMEDASDLLAALNIDEDTVEGKTGDKKYGSSESLKSLEEIVRGDAEANPDMSPNEWLQWYKKRPKKKAEESNFGAGQRGLGYGNEGHTVVQGSGQSHTISEIPPEMEVIVHDVNDIKESKKEGYTTEAGNIKAGDPSRSTDDDDSLLSQTFVKT